MSKQMQGEKEGRSAQMSEQLSKRVTVRGAGISIRSVREFVGSWSNSHRFIPLKQKVCLRSVAYGTNSGSSSPTVIVTCRQPRQLRSIDQPRLRKPLSELTLSFRYQYHIAQYLSLLLV